MLNFDTIDLAQAQERITAWQQSQKDIRGEVPAEMQDLPLLKIKAFTFHLREMFELCIRMYNYNNPESQIDIDVEDINDSPLNAIRFYAGIKSPEDTSPFACLIAVPVKGFDGVAGVGGDDLAELPFMEQPTASSLYDFSFPCPMTCANPGQSIMDLGSQQKK